jgi:hypothetical protein
MVAQLGSSQSLMLLIKPQKLFRHLGVFIWLPNGQQVLYINVEVWHYSNMWIEWYRNTLLLFPASDPVREGHGPAQQHV